MSGYDFDFRQLEVFCKVVDLGSFSRAAEAVFLAQATVSERVANLEKSMGVSLLDRLGRQVTPTRAGQLLYRQAVKILEMKDLARMEMEEFVGLKQGEVKIGGSTIPGEYVLPQLLGRFRGSNPGISLDVSVADSRKIERLVLEGTLEMGIIGYREVHPNLAGHDLWQDELIVAVPRDHPWAGLEDVSAHDLVKQPFLLRERGSGTLKIMEEYLAQAGIDPSGGLRVSARLGSSTAVKEGIKAGLGISILSSRAVATEVGLGVLQALRVRGLAMTRKFSLIQDTRRTASPPCRTLLGFLLDSAERNTVSETRA